MRCRSCLDTSEPAAVAYLPNSHTIASTKTTTSPMAVCSRGNRGSQVSQVRVRPSTRLSRERHGLLSPGSWRADDALISSPHHGTEGGGAHPRPAPHDTMALFIISIPLMVLAVAVAIVPLVMTSHSEHRERMALSAVQIGARSELVHRGAGDSDRGDASPPVPMAA